MDSEGASGMSPNLQKHTLNLFPGDYAKIQSLHPDLGAGIVIRRIVRNYIERLEAGDKLPKLQEGVNL